MHISATSPKTASRSDPPEISAYAAGIDDDGGDIDGGDDKEEAD